MENKAMDATALTISIIGAINWGLIGFFNYNLVSGIFGAQLAVVSRIIYAVVGLSLWQHDLAIQDHLCHCRNLRNLSVEFLHQNRKRIVDPG